MFFNIIFANKHLPIPISNSNQNKLEQPLFRCLFLFMENYKVVYWKLLILIGHFALPEKNVSSKLFSLNFSNHPYLMVMSTLYLFSKFY